MRKLNSHNAQAVLVSSMWLQCGTDRYVSLVHLHFPWFNDFCSDLGCCSGAKVYEGIPSTSATDPIARTSSGVIIAHSTCRCSDIRYTSCTRNSSRTTSSHLMVGSHCIVSLLHISARQWSLIQLVLQLPDNCFAYGSRDSALVTLSLYTSFILFPCRETRAPNLIMLIVASEGRCFPCFPLSHFPFPPGSSTTIPVISGRSENDLQQLYPTL
jgi:hypothetical protein